MIKTKNIFGFGVLVAIFSILIFVGEAFLYGFAEKNEEDFLEISVYESSQEEKVQFINLTNSILKKKHTHEEELKKQQILEQIEILKQEEKQTEKENKLTSAMEVEFMYIPENFESKVITDSHEFNGVLNGDSFRSLIKKITLSFYEQRTDVRGKMKNKTIKIFGPNQMEEDELLGIFIHELSHYIDLYFFERIGGADISNQFYDISWYSTIVMNSGLTQKDFVSGYGMTNKYEDFAESLTYFIFHNDDFITKMQDSDILVKKYNFIKNALFGDDSFLNTDFSIGNEVKPYYRDITKIDFSKKNFLQYVKNSI